MANQPSEHLVKVIANVPDRNGNTMMYEDDAVSVWVALSDAGYAVIEKLRLEAEMRMLVASGVMSPLAERQIKLSLGLIPASEEVG